MNELVSLKGNDIFTDSKVIADGTGNKHHAIQQLISKYESDFAEFGQVAFEMRAVTYARGTNYEKIYLLNEEQATLLKRFEDRRADSSLYFYWSKPDGFCRRLSGREGLRWFS